MQHSKGSPLSRGDKVSQPTERGHSSEPASAQGGQKTDTSGRQDTRVQKSQEKLYKVALKK